MQSLQRILLTIMQHGAKMLIGGQSMSLDDGTRRNCLRCGKKKIGTHRAEIMFTEYEEGVISYRQMDLCIPCYEKCVSVFNKALRS
jgi:hypothetical protein